MAFFLNVPPVLYITSGNEERSVTFSIKTYFEAILAPNYNRILKCWKKSHIVQSFFFNYSQVVKFIHICVLNPIEQCVKISLSSEKHAQNWVTSLVARWPPSESPSGSRISLESCWSVLTTQSQRLESSPAIRFENVLESVDVSLRMAAREGSIRIESRHGRQWKKLMHCFINGKHW
jgi:hypothetical protein